jgi:hypothetical protein
MQPQTLETKILKIDQDKYSNMHDSYARYGNIHTLPRMDATIDEIDDDENPDLGKR